MKSIERRIKELEEKTRPKKILISTWVDLMMYADLPEDEVELSPEMEELVVLACREEPARSRCQQPRIV